MRWPTVILGEIAELVTKGTTPTTLGHQFTEEGVNFIKAEALNGDSGLDPSGFFFIDQETHEMLGRSILKEEDVLVTIAGAQIGKCGFAKKEHLPANTNQAVGIVRIDPNKAVPRFVYYFFKQIATFSLIQSLGAQAAQPNLNLTRLKQIELPQPSLREQDRIARFLSDYDDLIENNRRRMAMLQEAARLLYREWFVRLRFPGHEHSPIVNDVPEGWHKASVSALGMVLTGKTPPTKYPGNYGSEMPFIKTPDMHASSIVVKTESYLSEKGAESQANKRLPPHSIMVACIGNKLGVVALNAYNAQTNQQINSLIPFKDYYRYYAYFVLSNMKGRLEAMGGGATMPNVSKSKFESMTLVIPNKQLLVQFHNLAAPLFKQIQRLTETNIKLSEARDILLPHLMSGEITV
jgi:type I restriction enzyme S subunit